MEEGKDARQGWRDGVSGSRIISGRCPLGELLPSFGKGIRQKREKDVRGTTTLLFSWKDQISAHEVSGQFWKPVRIQEWGQVKLVFTVFGRKKKSNLHYHLWDANTFLMLKRLCFNYLLQSKFLMESNLLNLFFLLINLSFGVQELFFLTLDLKIFLLYLFP